MSWELNGLLFENCNCQLICPAHISFKQFCTHEICHGHWSIHIHRGHFGETSLDGLNVVVVFESPQRMYEGGWKQALYIDRRADQVQREAIESVLRGEHGGPWEVLAAFVGTWLPASFVDMRFEDQGRVKKLRIDPGFETEVKAIRPSDGRGVASLENLFNQIHGTSHVLARGSTRCQGRGLDFVNEGSHGLYSDFHWEGALRSR